MLERIVTATLRSEKRSLCGEIGLVFVDEATIRRLHRRFLNDGTSTDVIAFPYSAPQDKCLIGDIAICVPVARRQARALGEPGRREIMRLVVHGLLHLLGYDDHKPNDRRRMWKRQEALIQRLWAKRLS